MITSCSTNGTDPTQFWMADRLTVSLTKFAGAVVRNVVATRVSANVGAGVAAAVTSVGIGTKASWDGMLAGREGCAPIPYFDTAPYKIHTAHIIDDLPRETTPHELACMAAREAVAERATLEKAMREGKAAAAKPARETLAPGLTLEAKSGRVVLSGKGVDAGDEVVGGAPGAEACLARLRARRCSRSTGATCCRRQGHSASDGRHVA